MRVIVFSFLVLLFREAPAAELKSFRWSAPERTQQRLLFWKTKKPSLQAMIDARIPTSLGSLTTVENEEISRSHQYVSGALVQGSWVQTVRGRSGRTVYAAGALLDPVPPELESAVQNLLRTENDLELKARVQKLLPEVPATIFAPRLELARNPQNGNFEPEWVIEFVNHSETEAWQARFGAQGNITALSRVSAQLADGEAMVYPNGPKLSTLTNVKLPSMKGDGTLSSAWGGVFSAIDPQAVAADLVFQYNVKDARFDEVQAYYYVDRALDWFESTLSTALSGPLQVRTHVGTDGKSNAAFYFGKRIYLGTGDGVVYQDLMRDPSVVMHETAHSIIDEVAALPSQGEGGSLNEGFADFFTACILENPNIGEASYVPGPYRRTLNNALRAQDAKPDDLYGNGTIVGATFWEIRKTLGTRKAAELALRTLARLGQGGKLGDLGAAATLAIQAQGTPDEIRVVTQILQARGWTARNG